MNPPPTASSLQPPDESPLRFSILFGAILALSLCSCKRAQDEQDKSQSSSAEQPIREGRSARTATDMGRYVEQLNAGRVDLGTIYHSYLADTGTKDKAYFIDLFNALESVQNGDDRHLLRAGTLARMAAAGHLAEAMDLLPKGSGLIREQYLSAIFEGVKGEDSDVRAMIESLPTEKDRSAAWQGYVAQWAGRENLDGFDINHFVGIGNKALSQLTGSLWRYARPHEATLNESEKNRRSEEVVGILKEMSRMRLIPADQVFEFAVASRDGDIRAALVAVEALSAEEGFTAAGERFSERLFRSLVADDPEGVVSGLVGNNTGEPITKLRTAFDQWLKLDSGAAEEWFNSNQSGMRPEERAEISAVFSRTAAREKDFAKAWEWVEKIEDPERRKKAEGQVWPMERDALRADVGRDPVGMVESLISGQSQYADYWIQEAMMTWISKEPEKAEEWYQANWKSLPSAKSQYVAAAYAKNALGLGDAATARQWSNLIQDPKTRERIEASITKAEAGGP